MHSSSAFASIPPLLFFLLLTSTFALPAPSTATAYTDLIIHDIGAISTAVIALTQNIDAYQGGTLAATPLFADVLDIHVVNRKAFVDAAPPLAASPAESRRIVVFTENSVGQTIPASVDALISKKPQLEDAGGAAFVVPGLKLLKRDHDSYSAELLQKVAPEYLARAKAVVAKIDNAIQAAKALREVNN